MRKCFRKPVAVLAAMATVASLLAGCGSKTGGTSSTGGETKETSKAAEGSSNANAGGEVSYPLADGGELTYWLQLNTNASANFTNLGETELGKALQEQTGITIKFQHPAAGADQAKEQFNLIVADGNLPDIMEWQWVKMYPGGPEKAIKDGVIIPLNDIIDQYCPNLRKYLTENPDVDKMIKTDDGNYFAFPFILSLIHI